MPPLEVVLAPEALARDLNEPVDRDAKPNQLPAGET